MMLAIWRGVVVSWTFIILVLCLWKFSCCKSYSNSSHESPQSLAAAALLNDSLPKSPNRLIDLNEFAFDRDQPCDNATVVVLVHSAPRNLYNRNMIRATWGRKIKVFFLLGESEIPLENEERQFKDMIRGNFKDTYKNLTYKHTMGLRWATSRCPQIEYLVKTDDDVYVHPPSLAEWLSLAPQRGLIACPVEEGSLVKRSFRSKWRVSHKEYPDRYYPRYCMGWAVIYSADAARTLHDEAQKSPYFWIDDVHVTGILAARASLSHTPLGDLALKSPEEVGSVLDGSRSSDFIFLLTTPDKFPFVPSAENQITRNSL